MLKYLTTARTGPGHERGIDSVSAGGMDRLLSRVLRRRLTIPHLEDARNHLVERRVLYTQINDGVAIKNRRDGLGDADAVHLQLRFGAVAGVFAEAPEIGGRFLALEV